MANVIVNFHTEQAVSAFDQLGRRGESALRRALKRTTASVRASMASDIAKDIGLPVGKVRDEMRVSVSGDELESTISISGRRIPLINFGARGPEPSKGRGRGVSATSEGQRKRYPNAFIATTASGHRGVFIRAKSLARKSRGAWSANLPIIELRGPSLPLVFTKHLPDAVSQAQATLMKNLQHELSFAQSQE